MDSTREFGQVIFENARTPAANMIGKPGEGWRVAMTIVSHEREPHELGYAARYMKTVKELEKANGAAAQTAREEGARIVPGSRRAQGRTGERASPPSEEHVQVLLNGLMAVEAELRVALATARLVRFNVEATEYDHFFEDKHAHRVDLSLTPRPRDGRACYAERWRPNRFEPLGDLMFVPAGEVIRVTGGRACRSSISCELNADPLRGLLEDDFTLAEGHLDATLDIASPTIRSLILRLGEEARHPGFASRMLAELIVGQLVIELFRYPGEKRGPARGGLAPWRLRMIDDRLAEQHSIPTLVELARLCRLSVRQLTRRFRASRGCSIGAYVTRSQIDHAKRLLASGESIKSISDALGFASASSFTYAFRRATGQTPGRFRESDQMRRAATACRSVGSAFVSRFRHGRPNLDRRSDCGRTPPETRMSRASRPAPG